MIAEAKFGCYACEVRIVLHAIRQAPHTLRGQPERKLIAPIKNGGISMHASTATSESPRPTVDKGRSKDERQAEEEGRADTVSKPGGFDNDPDDPTNPNEVRERHLKKIKK
jgi:hypothetical protein